MELDEIFNILNSIQGFKNKVAYRLFPENEAPELPYICYLETKTDNITADNHVIRKCQELDIELYSDFKDTASENLIEQALNEHDILWDKYEEYLSDERMFEIIYTINV